MPPSSSRPRPPGAPRTLQRQKTTGYYKDPDTGDKYRSVTTILTQGVPKEALPFWAGNLTAESAMANLPWLVKMSRKAADRTEAYDWLRRAHTRKKDERADVGTAVHKVIEAHLLQQPIPDAVREDPEMAVFIDWFEAFVRDWEVDFEASEMVVANTTDMVAGTLDFILRSPRIIHALIEAGMLPPDADPSLPLMGDTKTGGEICLGDGLCVKVRPYEFKKGCPKTPHPIKGVYPEAGLQMSAYRAADIAWLRDGTKVPMPPTHPVGVVLHLRPEGYLLVPARCDDIVFDHFRHAQHVARWTSETSKTVLGGALTSPALVKASAECPGS